jgi:predicted nuclease of predicted toxin-antitoxin system
MPQTLRFHLDEHVPGAIAAGLRRRGMDVTTAADAGFLGAEDEAHLAFALSQVRVLYTNDEDYLVLHDQGTPHAGIAYCHLQSCSIGDVIRALTLLWELLEPDDMRNHVEFL